LERTEPNITTLVTQALSFSNCKDDLHDCYRLLYHVSLLASAELGLIGELLL